MNEVAGFRCVGQVVSSRDALRDDHWGAQRAHIRLAADLGSEPLMGLETFSHALIVFLMDRVRDEEIELRSRHPRNNPDWPRVGIFAQRGKNRPNRIGVSVCAIEKVQNDCLYLRGLDAVNGTPVLDIKPWVEEFGPHGPVAQPEWMTELMADYWL